ncbi:single-stranded DNA-binding protein [Flavobacterium sp. CSZ]|uniref:single-stranded DNA-binding protein n=1 Tax=Flavobacterium sp. CSZ TaxID=2783791 RepID=UPI00322141ED
MTINDSYKPKGSTDYKQITTFIDCSYWLNAKLVEWLKKGALVQLFGRVGLNTYIGHDGSAMGSLTFHINSLKFWLLPKKMMGLRALLSRLKNKTSPTITMTCLFKAGFKLYL